MICCTINICKTIAHGVTADLYRLVGPTWQKPKGQQFQELVESLGQIQQQWVETIVNITYNPDVSYLCNS
jgi:hypothetical protein